MAAAPVTLLLFVLLLPSLTIYTILLLTIIKYRNVTPCNSSFFKLCLPVGLTDIGLLLVNWTERAASMGWFGIASVLALAPETLAKAHVMVRFYFTYSQFVGIVLLALNRVTVIKTNKDWKSSHMKLAIAANFLVPIVPQIYLAQYDFTYHIENGTDAAHLTWKNPQALKYFLICCGVVCALVSIFCCAAYSVAYAQVLRKQMKRKITRGDRTETRATGIIRKNAAVKKRNREVRLAIVGSVLFINTCACSMLCTAFAFVSDSEILFYLSTIFVVIDDTMCWLNPYLILACSKHLRRYILAFLKCKPQTQVTPMTNM